MSEAPGKKRILIVEDEAPMRKMLVLELQAAGYETAQAGSGVEALQVLEAFLPDVVITDVMMPDMDGFGLYKELKKRPFSREIPVLVLTARGKMEDAFLGVGADEFLTKPFQSEDLLSKVDRLLRRQGSPAAARVQKRVLLAGESEETLENMALQLKRAGCHVDLVASAAQVISKVVMFLPQVLVMDVQMDGLDGPQIISILRKLPQSEKIPILVYSYYRVADLGSEDVRQKALSVDAAVNGCLEAGASEYLGRFNENAFMKHMDKYLR